MSQKAVAIAARMDPSYVSALESGRRPAPKSRQVIRLARALNASPAEQVLLQEACAIAHLSRVVSVENTPHRQMIARLIVMARRLNDADLGIVYRIASGMCLTATVSMEDSMPT